MLLDVLAQRLGLVVRLREAAVLVAALVALVALVRLVEFALAHHALHRLSVTKDQRIHSRSVPCDHKKNERTPSPLRCLGERFILAGAHGRESLRHIRISWTRSGPV